jgi:hypothetical protein
MCRVNSAKALSRYSDMVDAMWRQQRELLDVASDDARLKLRQWELPEALQVRWWNMWPCLKFANFRDKAEMLCNHHDI